MWLRLLTDKWLCDNCDKDNARETFTDPSLWQLILRSVLVDVPSLWLVASPNFSYSIVYVVWLWAGWPTRSQHVSCVPVSVTSTIKFIIFIVKWCTTTLYNTAAAAAIMTTAATITTTTTTKVSITMTYTIIGLAKSSDTVWDLVSCITCLPFCSLCKREDTDPGGGRGSWLMICAHAVSLDSHSNSKVLFFFFAQQECMGWYKLISHQFPWIWHSNHPEIYTLFELCQISCYLINSLIILLCIGCRDGVQ